MHNKIQVQEVQEDLPFVDLSATQEMPLPVWAEKTEVFQLKRTAKFVHIIIVNTISYVIITQEKNLQGFPQLE